MIWLKFKGLIKGLRECQSAYKITQTQIFIPVILWEGELGLSLGSCKSAQYG